MTSKERAELRGQAQKLDAILQIGKDGISYETVQTADQALFARELIKVSVLENCPLDTKEAAIELSERTQSEVIQVIGRKFVLYKKADKEAKKELKRLKK
ncbi:MAG: YhbY family RNA-binding protein [Clostridia bacterium]|nr:YhbY family RNA-binding protein [Clostridia bacterium]